MGCPLQSPAKQLTLPGAVVSAGPGVTVYLPLGVDNYSTDAFSLELQRLLELL